MSDDNSQQNDPRQDEPRNLNRPGEGGSTFEAAAAGDESLQDVHQQLMREKQEPTERFLPMPLFLVLLISGLAFWAGIYLVKYSAEFDPMIYDETMKPGEAIASEPAEFDPMKAGARFFSRNCTVCHQAGGKGVPGQFPPLADSNWVQGDPERLAKILLHGMSGPITVDGESYNGAMPTFGMQDDRDIAAVLTYIRTSEEFGNNAEPVEESFVTEIREKTSSRSGPYDGPTLQQEYGVQ